MAGERILQYEAAILLRKTLGLGYWRTAKIISELLNTTIKPDTVKFWFRGVVPYGNSPLLKAIFYTEAYEIANKLYKKYGFGITRISNELRKIMGIRIPKSTIKGWIKESKKPIYKIILHPELGYVIGVIKTDGSRGINNTLKTRDKDFAETFAQALSIITEKRYSINQRLSSSKTPSNMFYDRIFYYVYVSRSPIRYISSTKLWKIIGYIYPKEFLQGVFDGDGGVSVKASNRFCFAVTLSNSNPELVDFVATLLLKKYNIKTNKYKTSSKVLNLYIYTKECEKFYNYINFRINRKKYKLKDALNILKKYGKNIDYLKEWRRLYKKVNGRWIRASPTPNNKNN